MPQASIDRFGQRGPQSGNFLRGCLQLAQVTRRVACVEIAVGNDGHAQPQRLGKLEVSGSNISVHQDIAAGKALLARCCALP